LVERVGHGIDGATRTAGLKLTEGVVHRPFGATQCLGDFLSLFAEAPHHFAETATQLFLTFGEALTVALTGLLAIST
jgi:hypothetical protein